MCSKKQHLAHLIARVDSHDRYHEYFSRNIGSRHCVIASPTRGTGHFPIAMIFVMSTRIWFGHLGLEGRGLRLPTQELGDHQVRSGGEQGIAAREHRQQLCVREARFWQVKHDIEGRRQAHILCGLEWVRADLREVDPQESPSPLRIGMRDDKFDESVSATVVTVVRSLDPRERDG